MDARNQATKCNKMLRDLVTRRAAMFCSQETFLPLSSRLLDSLRKLYSKAKLVEIPDNSFAVTRLETSLVRTSRDSYRF